MFARGRDSVCLIPSRCELHRETEKLNQTLSNYSKVRQLIVPIISLNCLLISWQLYFARGRDTVSVCVWVFNVNKFGNFTDEAVSWDWQDALGIKTVIMKTYQQLEGKLVHSHVHLQLLCRDVTDLCWLSAFFQVNAWTVISEPTWLVDLHTQRNHL